jgi:hypothetical protein
VHLLVRKTLILSKCMVLQKNYVLKFCVNCSAEGTGNRQNSVALWLRHWLTELSLIRFVAGPKKLRHYKGFRRILDTTHTPQFLTPLTPLNYWPHSHPSIIDTTHTPQYPSQRKPGGIFSGGVVNFDTRFCLVRRSWRLGEMPKYQRIVRLGGHENLEL